jgi:hypothetical protein
MKPRYVSGWIAKRNIGTDDAGELVTDVTLELNTDRGKVFLICTPECAANIGWDLIGEGTGFAYNTIPADAEGENE